MSQKKNSISKDEAIRQLWSRGLVHWKLDSCQKQLYHKFKSSKYKTTVFSASRRIGKTTTLLVLAIEFALQNPDSQIKYGAPTAKMVKKMIEPTLKMLLSDCPKELRPRYDRNEGVYIFKNGSKLFIEGLNEGNAENLRGTAMHLGIVDEAGFVTDLRYVVGSILLPQALTTKGKVVIASTPPVSPEHDFVKYIQEAQFNGAFIKKTIYDYLEDVKNDPPQLRDRITREELEDIKLASGGEDSVEFRREYLCDILVDTDAAIIPEFTEKLKQEVVKVSKKPDFYDAYVSLDIGYNDFHAALFAYYDFTRNVLVIEDEILVRGRDTNTAKLAAAIKEKESILWRNEFNETKKPYLRVADDDMVTIKDLQELHNITFIPTKKDDKQAAVNEGRIRLAAGHIEINPRCANFITQLESGIWANYRDGSLKTSFARTRESGHFDLLDAYLYLVRNVQWHKNPFPKGYGKDGLFVSPKATTEASQVEQVFKSIFSKRKF